LWARVAIESDEKAVGNAINVRSLEMEPHETEHAIVWIRSQNPDQVIREFSRRYIADGPDRPINELITSLLTNFSQADLAARLEMFRQQESLRQDVAATGETANNAIAPMRNDLTSVNERVRSLEDARKWLLWVGGAIAFVLTTIGIRSYFDLEKRITTQFDELRDLRKQVGSDLDAAKGQLQAGLALVKESEERVKRRNDELDESVRHIVAEHIASDANMHAAILIAEAKGLMIPRGNAPFPDPVAARRALRLCQLLRTHHVELVRTSATTGARLPPEASDVENAFEHLFLVLNDLSVFGEDYATNDAEKREANQRIRANNEKLRKEVAAILTHTSQSLEPDRENAAFWKEVDGYCHYCQGIEYATQFRVEDHNQELIKKADKEFRLAPAWSQDLRWAAAVSLGQDELFLASLSPTGILDPAHASGAEAIWQQACDTAPFLQDKIFLKNNLADLRDHQSLGAYLELTSNANPKLLTSQKRAELVARAFERAELAGKNVQSVLNTVATPPVFAHMTNLEVRCMQLQIRVWIYDHKDILRRGDGIDAGTRKALNDVVDAVDKEARDPNSDLHRAVDEGKKGERGKLFADFLVSLRRIGAAPTLEKSQITRHTFFAEFPTLQVWLRADWADLDTADRDRKTQLLDAAFPP
jgi:hypothetical protein